MNAADVLRVRFGVDVESLQALDVRAYNLHYVARTSGGDMHVTLRDLDEAEAAELEAISGIVATLEGPTTELASSGRRSTRGLYLEPSPAGYVSVRRHDGRAWGPSDDPALLPRAIAVHGEALDRAVPDGELLRSGAPRFAAPHAALDAVHAAVRSHLSQWLSDDERLAFDREIGELRDGSVGSPERLRAVHGDADVANVAIVGGTVQFIDHDCMHWDHPLHDVAHLMLSACCAAYFSGPLDAGCARRFLACVGSDARERALVCDVARYVMLEKLLGVNGALSLHARTRLGVLDGLRRLAADQLGPGRS